jgi:hypothetical protein
MKRKAIVMSCVALLIVGIVLVLCLSGSSGNITFSFVGYGPDGTGLRSNLYSLPDETARSMALFHIENHSRRQFIYHQGHIYVRSAEGWTQDTNQLPRIASADILRSGSSIAIRVPTPAGTNSWRVRFVLTELDPSGLRNGFVQLCRRIGIDIDNPRVVLTSSEIVR